MKTDSHDLTPIAQRHPHRTRRLVILLAATALVFGGVIGFNLFKAAAIRKFAAANALQPATVSTTVAQRQPWQAQVKAVGSLRAVHGVDVAFEVGGLVHDMHFKSGQQVTAGALLVELNADSDIATLRAQQAAADLAASVLERDRAQFAAQAISKAQLDADAADVKSKQAQVQAQQALIDKKSIRAPFTGRLGISTVAAGQYVAPGDKIVTLQATDPILVDFRLPQQQLDGLAPGQRVVLAIDAFPGRSFEGRISALSPRIEADTRNVEVEAQLPNPRHELMPGMYASVAVDRGEPQPYLTLPSAAVAYNPYGSTVFVARHADGGASAPSLQAQQVFVTTGPARGDQVAIVSGLDDGTEVVTSGQLKLKNGTPLVVDNRVQPPANPAPQVQEQ